MTALTGAPETTLVPIISGVAAGAIARDIIGTVTVMATATAQVSMGASEGKIRCAVVIKVPQGPAVGCMAALTLDAQGRFVGVFCLMAIHTPVLCRMKFRAGMTGLARRYGMHPLQREPG
jgi:hypothetical protein